MPVACLMNHAAAAPHIWQYGQLLDGWLHFPASRAISEGEQVHFAKHVGPQECGIHCHTEYLLRHIYLCRPAQVLMPDALCRCTCTMAHMTTPTCWSSMASCCRTTPMTASASASK